MSTFKTFEARSRACLRPDCLLAASLPQATSRGVISNPFFSLPTGTSVISPQSTVRMTEAPALSHPFRANGSRLPAHLWTSPAVLHLPCTSIKGHRACTPMNDVSNDSTALALLHPQSYTSSSSTAHSVPRLWHLLLYLCINILIQPCPYKSLRISLQAWIAHLYYRLLVARSKARGSHSRPWYVHQVWLQLNRPSSPLTLPQPSLLLSPSRVLVIIMSFLCPPVSPFYKSSVKSFVKPRKLYSRARCFFLLCFLSLFLIPFVFSESKIPGH